MYKYYLTLLNLQAYFVRANFSEVFEYANQEAFWNMLLVLFCFFVSFSRGSASQMFQKYLEEGDQKFLTIWKPSGGIKHENPSVVIFAQTLHIQHC